MSIPEAENVETPEEKLIHRLARLYYSPALEIARSRACDVVQELVLRRTCGESLLAIVRAEKLHYWTLIAEEVLKQVDDARLFVHVENSVLKECRLGQNPVTKETKLECVEVQKQAQAPLPIASSVIEDVLESIRFIRNVMNTESRPVVAMYVLYSEETVRKVLYYTICELESCRNFMTAGHTVILYVPLELDVPRHGIDLTYYTSATVDDVYDLVTRLGEVEENVRKLTVQDMQYLARACAGLDLALIEAKLREVGERYSRARLLTRRSFSEYVRDFIESVRTSIVKRELAGIEIYLPKEGDGFCKVAGLEKVKNFIRRVLIVPFHRKEQAEELGLALPRGFLFFGPEGTGKTHLATAIAGELGIPLVRFNISDVMDCRYGESEKLMRKFLHTVPRLAPCIVFIDEIDQLGTRAGLVDADSGTTRRLFSMLLQWLGDDEARKNVIVIGTTNVPHILDPAFIRVGRFDYIIPILYPEQETRRQILRYYLAKRRTGNDVNSVLDKIVDLTCLWTSSELKFLVEEASRIALEKERAEIRAEDLLEAVQRIRVNYEERLRKLEQYVEISRRMCNVEELLEYGQEILNEARQKLSRLEGSRIDIVKRFI